MFESFSIGSLFGKSEPRSNENIKVEEKPEPVGSHLDDWKAPEDDLKTAEIQPDEKADLESSSSSIGSTSDLMSLEEFKASIQTMSELGAVLSMIQAVRIDANGNPIHESGLEAIYETCLEVPWLRICLNPNSSWLTRFIAIATFSATYAVGIKAELQEKRQAAKQARAEAAKAQEAAKNEVVGSFNEETEDFDHIGMSPAQMGV